MNARSLEGQLGRAFAAGFRQGWRSVWELALAPWWGAFHATIRVMRGHLHNWRAGSDDGRGALMARRPGRRSRPPAYRPLPTQLRPLFRPTGGRAVRCWRLRNAIERQELQVLIDRANDLFVCVPIPRYPARHHVLNPPFRSSAHRLTIGSSERRPHAPQDAP